MDQEDVRVAVKDSVGDGAVEWCIKVCAAFVGAALLVSFAAAYLLFGFLALVTYPIRRTPDVAYMWPAGWGGRASPLLPRKPRTSDATGFAVLPGGRALAPARAARQSPALARLQGPVTRQG
ncbi:MAG: hypothetical protein H0V64_14190 [Geodermatophilaceae bacterium]|nr:hypothetical protein [Geodermatophilaceae bacterium]